MPTVPGWDCAALCQPAHTVAGDYYDLFEFAPGRLALALGDVSGKGLGPALVMAGLRSLVRCLLPLWAPDLTGLLHELNRHLLATTPDDMFVTLFLAILDVGTGRLNYVNAGHPPALVLGGPTQEVIKLTEGGTVLGILADAPFHSAEVVLEPGNCLVLYSDGLTEAVNAAGEMFREERLLEALRRTWPAPAGLVLAELVESVQAFAQGMEPADDLSLVIVHRTERKLWVGVPPLAGAG
jgi:sigma-B regulation protein RsbU (phosphoserine phosphatase)